MDAARKDEEGLAAGVAEDEGGHLSSVVEPVQGDQPIVADLPAKAPLPCAGKPTCVLILGMAGSGKTTAISKIAEKRPDAAFVNLDPAVVGPLPYRCQIDIRSTVNYREVMRKYRLGPNGAIITCLNLFATKIHQLVELVMKKNPPIVFFDTPGQIEVFTWSASGSIILESLASAMPTCVLFIVDVPRCAGNPIAFMSNMLYACSIMYRSRLPMRMLLNKNDIIHHQPIMEWIQDFTVFQQALDRQEEVDQSYAYSLARSLSLALDEFYSLIHAVGFSSISGDGWPQLEEELESARNEYLSDFLSFYEQLKKGNEHPIDLLIGTPSYFRPNQDDPSEEKDEEAATTENV